MRNAYANVYKGLATCAKPSLIIPNLKYKYLSSRNGRVTRSLKNTKEVIFKEQRQHRARICTLTLKYSFYYARCTVLQIADAMAFSNLPL